MIVTRSRVIGLYRVVIPYCECDRLMEISARIAHICALDASPVRKHAADYVCDCKSSTSV